jgi:hypothetical protein
MLFRVCRECGEEFRPEVPVCTDCGGPLEDRDDEMVATPAPEEPLIEATRPPQGTPRWLHRTSSAAEMEPLAARLAAAQIPFAVRGSINAFDLLIPDEHMETAREVLRGALPSAAELNPEGAFARCPACEAELAPGAQLCPDCGLSVGTQPTCSRCGGLLDMTAKACASCGFEEP